jgi:hypothetical protein
MKKRILFISLGVLLLIAFVFLLITTLGKKTPTQKDQSTSESAKYTSEANNGGQNIQNVETKIKFVADSPSSPRAIENGYEAIKFEDASSNKITLADFKKEAGISVISQLNKHLDEKGYDMFYCPADGGKKEYAIYFGYNVDRAYTIRYPDVVTWMNDWEKTMLPDLHAVLFPNVKFSDSELKQDLQFKDGKFRYAEVRFPGGQSGSINYRVSFYGVILSSSLSCLEKMVEIYEPLEP